MKIIEELDTSMMNDFRKCPRYFELRHVEHLSLKTNPAKAKPEFGSALHDALESWYTHHDPSKMDRAFGRRWGPFEGDDETGIRTIMKGLAITKKYRDYFVNEPFDIIDLEIGGAVDMGTFVFLFRCDGLIQYKDRGDMMIFEHKTSAHKGFLIPKPNHQIDGYIYGVKELTGQNVTGAILNQIYFRKGRKTENIEDTISFNREETTRNDGEIERWRKEALWLAEQVQECCRREFFPRTTSACTQYGRCPYIELCQAGEGEIQDSIKNSMFQVEVWEPFTGARTLEKGVRDGNGES